MIRIHLLYGYSPWRRESSWISVDGVEVAIRGGIPEGKMAFSLKS